MQTPFGQLAWRSEQINSWQLQYKNLNEKTGRSLKHK